MRIEKTQKSKSQDEKIHIQLTLEITHKIMTGKLLKNI